MPISKAGIWTNPRPHIDGSAPMTAQGKTSVRAFTFVEVLVALAIASISVLALLKLNLVSISTADAARMHAQAVLLAQEKIAEILALGYPGHEVKAGIAERSGVPLYWRTSVADVQPSQLEVSGVSGLWEVSICVAWDQGTHRRHVQMSTYVADRRMK